MHRLSAIWPPLLTCAVILLAWQAISNYEIVNPALLPPPSRVFPQLWEMIASGAVLAPLGYTLGYLAVGYALGCGAGIVLGLLMGTNQHVFNLFEPLVELIRPIPKPALIPPLFLFIGIGPATKLTVIALATFFPVLLNTIQGVRGVDPVMVNTARTLGHSALSTILKIILPAALPLILVGMRLALGLALILVILAEMLIGSTGLGYQIIDLQRSFVVTEMFAWIIILGVIGVLLNAIFEQIERWAVPWRAK
jgi:ABC-type nitrate/sulfonate/bicarbonate transport system permease component